MKNIFHQVYDEFKKDPNLWILGGSHILKFRNKKQYSINRKAKYLTIDDIVNYDFPLLSPHFLEKKCSMNLETFPLTGFKRCHTNIFINYFLGTIAKQRLK